MSTDEPLAPVTLGLVLRQQRGTRSSSTPENLAGAGLVLACTLVWRVSGSATEAVQPAGGGGGQCSCWPPGAAWTYPGWGPCHA